MTEEFVTVARIVKTQGRRGEIAADVLTDFPEKFAERKLLFARRGVAPARELRVQDHWPHKNMMVFKFEGIDTISDAETIVGCELQIPKRERTALESGSYYVGDLVGCDLVDVASSQTIGTIIDVDVSSGEAPNLIVKAQRNNLSVPFAQAFVRRVDVSAKQVEMALPEGLLNVDAPLTGEEKLAQQRTKG